MGIAITIGILGGGYLDGRFGTAPVLFWVGFAIGLGAAVKAFYRGFKIARRIMEADDAATRKED